MAPRASAIHPAEAARGTRAPTVGIMQIVDSLNPGGMERVAVNLANLLPPHRYRSYLCTTRRDGSLADAIAPHVGRLRLDRRRPFDIRGVRRLISFVAAHDIDILHAHGTAAFLAVVASIFSPHPAVLWHDHYGRHVFDGRPAWLYRRMVRHLHGIVAVNRQLAEWARYRLHMPADRVWYIPNFIVESPARELTRELPGKRGARIVCAARLRPEKDHLTLLAAMAAVVKEVPDAHLLLPGGSVDDAYEARLRQRVQALDLGRHVSFLGHRDDVPAILRESDIGVLSSVSEGFPLALVEYGAARLPSVATAVGQCAEVLDEGRAGRLVPPESPVPLAETLMDLLRSPSRRRALGERLHERVATLYMPGPIMEQIYQTYEVVAAARRAAAIGAGKHDSVSSVS